MKKVFAVAVYKTIAGQVYVLAEDAEEALRTAEEYKDSIGDGFYPELVFGAGYELGDSAWENEYVDPIDCLNYEEEC